MNFFEKTDNKKIEVVTTNLSNLAMLGFGSIKNCQWVCEVLANRYKNIRLTIISTQSDLEDIVNRKPDLVIAGIKYVDFSISANSKKSKGKIWLSQFLEDHDINFTGSRRDAIELDFDKGRAKDVIRQHGIQTADYFIATPEQFQTEQELPVQFPLFLKPLFESDSKGVNQQSVVNDFNAFQKKVMSIEDDFDQPVLAETYLPGQEFTVAILESNNNEELMIMPVEIVIDDSQSKGILEYSTKKNNQEQLKAIAQLEIFEQVSELAKRAFIALGARDFGRIDIKMNEQGIPCFLEANLLPGMNMDNSYFPQACLICREISYRQLVNHMTDIAFKRQ
ncbi:MAG: D-alanine--D-alanine ligase [Bacillota bacterium]|nr:D-alanine--D-alanine ligase [Bacillota bacterium]